MVSFREKSAFQNRIWWKLVISVLVIPRGLPSSWLVQWLIAWEGETILEETRGEQKPAAGFDTHGEGRDKVFRTPEFGDVFGSGVGQPEENRRPWRNKQNQVSEAVVCNYGESLEIAEAILGRTSSGEIE